MIGENRIRALRHVDGSGSAGPGPVDEPDTDPDFSAFACNATLRTFLTLGIIPLTLKIHASAQFYRRVRHE